MQEEKYADIIASGEQIQVTDLSYFGEHFFWLQLLVSELHISVTLSYFFSLTYVPLTSFINLIMCANRNWETIYRNGKKGGRRESLIR